jgi:monovalent cation:H+ antiporter-2, CPA2 family
MLLTPFLIGRAHGLAFGLEGTIGRPRDAQAPETDEPEIAGHVIVMGYGLNGQNLARVLKTVGIPHRILDMDPGLVRRARSEAQEIHFGDGTSEEVMRKTGIERARVLVVAISDPVATARAVWLARRLNPELSIVVRTRYVAEIDHLYRLGASQVIPEEFETSVEIFARVLQEFHIPRNIISLQVELIRKERYGMLRGLRLEGKTLDRLSQLLVGTTTDTVLILQDSPAVGKTLSDLQIDSATDLKLIAVVRQGTSMTNPAPEFQVEVGDILVLLGNHKELDRMVQLLSPGEEAPRR